MWFSKLGGATPRFGFLPLGRFMNAIPHNFKIARLMGAPIWQTEERAMHR